MLKFDFSVQTRDGQKIDSILIGARDQAEAQRKLLQMYRQCVVLRCEMRENDERQRQAASVEEILTIISK